MSSGDYSAAATDEITKTGDEFSPSLKKPTTDPKAELVGEAEAESPIEFPTFRPKDWNDPEYKRQAAIFLEQDERENGFYMDLDKFDYRFAPVKFEWGLSFDTELNNKDLMDLLINTAIEAKNEDDGTQLEFLKYVSCNVTAAAGYCFYITLLAIDRSSPNPEPQLYQTLVSKFCDDIEVCQFKLKTPQQD